MLRTVALWVQIIAPTLQTVILAVTGWIVWRYTKETQRLRKEAQRQVEAAQQQTQEIQRQVEVQLRPYIVVTARWDTSRTLGTLFVHNIGNGAAINILITRGESQLRIPFLPRGEHVQVLVTTPTGSPRSIYNDQESRQYGDYSLPVEDLDDAQLAQGVLLTMLYNNVEYDNKGLTVEQHQYRTNVRMRSSGVEILSSWNISSSPQ